jgi:hypothetical protein
MAVFQIHKKISMGSLGPLGRLLDPSTGKERIRILPLNYSVDCLNVVTYAALRTKMG